MTEGKFLPVAIVKGFDDGSVSIRLRFSNHGCEFEVDWQTAAEIAKLIAQGAREAEQAMAAIGERER